MLLYAVQGDAVYLYKKRLSHRPTWRS